MPKQMSKHTFEKIESMLKNGEYTFIEIGECCGVSESAVGTIAHGRHFYQADEAEQIRRQKKAAKVRDGRSEPYYLPTPEEIAKECQYIQAARSLSKSNNDEDCDPGWMPPVYSELNLASM